MQTSNKFAVCESRVPAILSPTGKLIEIGDKVEYKRIVFRNGENHLVLDGAKQVPLVFFNPQSSLRGKERAHRSR